MSRSQTLLLASLLTISVIAGWGVLDPDGLVAQASLVVDRYFQSRGWFVMLSVSAMLFMCIWLAFSRYGNIRLGADDPWGSFKSPTVLTS